MTKSVEYSVIMAVKNGESFINDAILSIRNQTLIPSKIIIVNDHSSDRTVEIVESMSNNILLLHSEKHGQIFALNIGLENVRTKYLAFLDADDMWLPNKQMEAIEILENKPEISIVSHGTRNFENDTIDSIVKHKDYPGSGLFSANTFRTDSFFSINNGVLYGNPFTWQMQWWDTANKLKLTSLKLNQIGHLRRIHEKNLSYNLKKVNQQDPKIEFLRQHLKRNKP